MTTGRIDGAAATHAAQVRAGNASVAAAPRADAGDSASHGRVEVNDHPVVRKLLMGSGFAIAGAAGMGYALSRTPLLQKAGLHVAGRPGMTGIALGAAGLGAALVGSSFLVRPDYQNYLAPTVASREEAIAQAADYNRDIAVHRADSGRYGLLDLGAKSDVDNRGAASARLGNVDVPFSAITTRDGDLLDYADGTWINRGVVGAPTVDLASVDPSKPADMARLRGMQIGTDDRHNAVRIGERVGPPEGFATEREAAVTLFEQHARDLALLKLGGRFHAFAVTGDDFDSTVRARGTQLKPFAGVGILNGRAVHHGTRPGEAFPATALPQRDIGSVRASDAGSLTGVRIGSSGNSLVKLGSVAGNAGGYSSHAEAARAAHDMGAGAHVVLHLADRHVVFALQGAQPDRLVTLLGPPDRVTLQSGKKTWRSTSTEGNLTFAGRSVPFEPGEPIGSSLQIRGRGGEATGLVGTYTSRSQAIDQAARGDRAVIAANDRFYVYQLGNGRGPAWDDELGHVVATTERYSDSRSGTDYEGDSVYRTTESRQWTELYTDDGKERTIRDSGWYETSRTYDAGASEARRRARIEAEERARREAEERARQERENPSGGSGGTGGTGGSGGSGSGSGGSGGSNSGSGGAGNTGGGSSGRNSDGDF